MKIKRTGLVSTRCGMSALAVGDERNDAAVWKTAVGDAVNESLKVGAKARGHDRNAAWRALFLCHFEYSFYMK